MHCGRHIMPHRKVLNKIIRWSVCVAVRIEETVIVRMMVVVRQWIHGIIHGVRLIVCVCVHYVPQLNSADYAVGIWNF